MVALLIAAGVLWIGKEAAERNVQRIDAELAQTRRDMEAERERVRSRTALARAEDAAHAARVEREQADISKEVTNDYQKQLADLRRRYDALRLQPGGAAADPGGRGDAAVSGLSNSARGADGAAGQDEFSAVVSSRQLMPTASGSHCTAGQCSVPLADLLMASEQALRLEALQTWLREQVQVER
jgi:hypothetical protein